MQTGRIYRTNCKTTGCVKIKRPNTKIAIFQKCLNILHQILLFCWTHNWPQVCCSMLHLLDIRRNDRNWKNNLRTNFAMNKRWFVLKYPSSGLIVMIFMIFGARHHQDMKHQKIRNLSTSSVYCGRTTALPWKMQKVIFNNVIHMCFRMFRLLLENGLQLSQFSYQGGNFLQQVFEVTSLCANTTTESVTPLFDRLTHDAPLEFNPCLNQPLL